MNWSICYILLCYLLSFFISNPLSAQDSNIEFNHISLEQGLSQSVVPDIIQDKKGFLWIGTQDGLNRYDGLNFKVFKHDPADSSSISDNWINTMCLDNDVIWLGTEYGGVNKFDIKEQKFEEINIDSIPAVRAVCVDNDHFVWIATWGKGLYSYDPQKHTFNNYKSDPLKPNSISNDRIRSLYIDKENNIWVGTGLGLDKLNKRTGRIIHYYHNEKDQSSISGNFITSIIQDNKGRFWIGTSSGLNLFDPIKEIFISFKHDPNNSFSISEDYIMTCYEDADGNLWFGTYNGGLNRLISSKDDIRKPVDAKFISYKNDINNPASLNCNYVRKVFQDRSKVIWLGTWGGGLNKFDAKPQKFKTVKPVINQQNSLSFPFIRSLFKLESGLTFIGTDGNGIDIYDPGLNKFINYRFDPSDHSVSDYNYIYSFFEDDKGNIWIANFKGLHKLSKNQIQRIEKINIEELPLKNIDAAYIRTIFGYNKGYLLLGTNTGLAYLNIGNLKLKYFDLPKVDNKKPRAYPVTSICKDTKGRFWIGTIKGLIRADIEKANEDSLVIKKAEFYWKESRNLRSLSSDKINQICVSKNGTIWIGTNSGLNRYNELTNDFTYYITLHGMPNDIVNSIVEDENGRLWLSTNKGISRVTIEGEKISFRNYDAADGLQSNEFNQGASFISNDGEIFFGGINGYNHFYPDDVIDNPFKPQLVITNIKIWNKEIDSKRFKQNSSHVQVSYYENFISFEFAALDFTIPAKNRFQYKMEGFDEFWINSGNQNYANYTNLDPGEYIFKVRASNNDGVWNNEGISLYITVTPPYWMTWWFRIIVVIFVAGILFLIYKSRIKRLLELERLRTRIASDLHDEIGSSLTKISMNAGLINLKADFEKNNSRLRKIEEISREVISTMSDIVWSIDARNDALGDMIDRMRDFTNNILADKQIDFDFLMEGLNLQKKIPVDLRQNIYLIFKEAVNNAAKHSKATSMKIELQNNDNVFAMMIYDNGTGLPVDEKLKGHGLKNMKMRADRIGGKIEFSNCDGLKIVLKTKGL